MIKTLKSELNLRSEPASLARQLTLRPTYDEMIGMIEDADKENRPPIEKIIDRRATIFRNNQFGSQFDNTDFLGLKKQEEDRAKEEVRQAQLRQAGIMAGTSLMSGFTPAVSQHLLKFMKQWTLRLKPREAFATMMMK